MSQRSSRDVDTAPSQSDDQRPLVSAPGDDFQKPPMTTWQTIRYTVWLFCLCFCVAGVQFVYSIQFAVGGPLFSQKFKVSDSIISIILSTAGPISGFIVQPVVGVISDGCTFRYGRRRPFILLGAAFVVVGMAFLAFSDFIGVALGDDDDGKSIGDHWRGLLFAIFGLWVMNIATNVMQGPARALVSDVVDPDKQQLGNAMVSGTQGVANILANIIGAQFYTTGQPYVYMFSMGMGFVALSIIPTMIVAGEKQHHRKQGETMNIFGVFVKIYKGFRYMGFDMWKVVAVFYFSWAGYSPFMIYLTIFFGKNVNGGDPDKSQSVYEDGVKLGMYATACFAAVSFAYSLVMPYLLNVGVRPVYFLTQVIQTACFILFLFFDQVYVAFILTALVGINFTAFNSIPFALVTNMVPAADTGMYMGVLNSASVVAQTVTNSLASPIVSWKDENVAWGIAFGGIWAGLGALLIWVLPTGKGYQEVNGKEEDEEAQKKLSLNA